MPQTTPKPADQRFDPIFVERERDRFGARALGFLIALNGVAALVLLSNLGRASESSVDSKIAAAMLFFSGGAVAALLSAFLAYVNRTVTMEAPERASLRRGLQILGIVAVIGSAASFLTGMNMVASAAADRARFRDPASQLQFGIAGTGQAARQVALGPVVGQHGRRRRGGGGRGMGFPPGRNDAADKRAAGDRSWRHPRENRSAAPVPTTSFPTISCLSSPPTNPAGPGQL